MLEMTVLAWDLLGCQAASREPCPPYFVALRVTLEVAPEAEPMCSPGVGSVLTMAARVISPGVFWKSRLSHCGCKPQAGSFLP